MIESKDISFVVQGAINKKETPKCLKSIRKYFPNAEIILSTWEDSDISDLDYDIVVLNQDLGAVIIEEFSHKIVYNNMNRQLLTTKEGLKKASRKYAMKLRSDLIITTDKFLEYFDKFPERTQNYNLFKRKILAPALFTRFDYRFGKQYKKLTTPFHISDWWLFGLREDIETYFLDTKPADEPYFTKYFEQKENEHKISPYGKIKFKFAPEQYFGYECFSRNYDDIYMEDAADCTDELMEKSRECLVNNFIILEYKQSGIYLNKYPYSKNEKFSGDQYTGLYYFCRYELEYKKICDKNYRITSYTKMFENEKYGADLFRVYKHIAKLIDSSTDFVSKIEQFFIGIPISSISFILKHYNELFTSEKHEIEQ